MSTSVKLTLLTIISLISSWICFIFVGLTLFISNGELNETIFIINENWIALDVVVNAICLILQYKYYDEWYNLICNKCHLCCSNCCKMEVVIDGRHSRIVAHHVQVVRVGSISPK